MLGQRRSRWADNNLIDIHNYETEIYISEDYCCVLCNELPQASIIISKSMCVNYIVCTSTVMIVYANSHTGILWW